MQAQGATSIDSIADKFYVHLLPSSVKMIVELASPVPAELIAASETIYGTSPPTHTCIEIHTIKAQETLCIPLVHKKQTIGFKVTGVVLLRSVH